MGWPAAMTSSSHAQCHGTCPKDLPFPNLVLPCAPITSLWPDLTSTGMSWIYLLPHHHHLDRAMATSLSPPLLSSSWGHEDNSCCFLCHTNKVVLSVMQSFDNGSSCPSSQNLPKAVGGLVDETWEGCLPFYILGKGATRTHDDPFAWWPHKYLVSPQ